MTEILTARGMRALEARGMAAGAASAAELMERAGEGVVEAALAHWPGLAGGRQRATILCGPGNNGGDGLVIARLLQARGWQVNVLMQGPVARLSPEARANLDLWRARGPVGVLDRASFDAVPDCDLLVDAIYGAGLSRPLEGAVAELVRRIGGAGSPWRGRLVAVDGPSGLCLDSGQHPGLPRDSAEGALHAALTVTFDSPKVGHLIGLAPQVCGRLVVCDIGISAFRDGVGQVRLSPPWPGEGRPPEAGRLAKRAGHKFDHGHALVISGPAERSGAARLAARAALRVGAGLVTLAAPARDLAALVPSVTAVMLRGLSGPGDLGALLAADRRIGALCLGPGLGLDEDAAALVAEALAANRPLVLDADALTLIARDRALRRLVHPACVLTPHGGEFARLWPEIAARLVRWDEGAPPPDDPAPLYSKLDACRAAAAEIGATVLFKGADTVIADPGGAAVLHVAAYGRAAPWLATAGSGDVLAGLICGALARGIPPLTAAELGAWLHVETARRFGPGLIAEDLPEALPAALRDLLPPDA